MSNVNYTLLPKLVFFYLCKKILLAGLKLKILSPDIHARVFGILVQKSISSFRVHGARLSMSILDSGMASPLILRGKLDESSLRFLRKKLKQKIVVLDIGAHIGFYSTFFKRNVSGRGRLYCFEPDNFNFSLLEENIKTNRMHNVVLEKMAVSDKNGAANLYTSTNNFGDHHLYSSKKFRDPRILRKVQKISIDNYFKNKKLHIDFVKIDVQGMEPLVMKGMNKLINRQKHLSIFLELWPKGYAAVRHSPSEFIKQLKRKGFMITAVTRNSGIVKNVRNYNQIRTFAENEEFLDLFCEK